MSSADQLGLNFGEKRSDKSGDLLVSRSCAHCRKTVEVMDWYAEAVELHYCGDACRRAWTSEQLSLIHI